MSKEVKYSIIHFLIIFVVGLVLICVLSLGVISDACEVHNIAISLMVLVTLLSKGKAIHLCFNICALLSEQVFNICISTFTCSMFSAMFLGERRSHVIKFATMRGYNICLLCLLLYVVIPQVLCNMFFGYEYDIVMLNAFVTLLHLFIVNNIVVNELSKINRSS